MGGVPLIFLKFRIGRNLVYGHEALYPVAENNGISYVVKVRKVSFKEFMFLVEAVLRIFFKLPPAVGVSGYNKNHKTIKQNYKHGKGKDNRQFVL
jgi:hypothetical protein